MRKESFKKSAKRWLAVILCLCLIGMMIPVTAMAAEASGNFSNGGNEFHWELDSNGTLTITITTASTGEDAGAMPEWDFDNSPPWYDLKSNIKKVIIGSGVTTIGENAFLSCINLNEVELHEGLTKIGAAFANCSALTSITIPASVTEIDEKAFYNCSNLRTVNFAEGSELGWIGIQAFYGCTSLTSITIPASVTVIASQAFQGCTGLKTITLAEGSNLGTIYDSAFANCTALTTIIFECDELHGAFVGTPFAGCNNITTIRVPAGRRSYYSPLMAHFPNAQIAESIANSNLGWALDSTNTKLTITGTGDMPDWAVESYVPWYGNRSNIKKVIIGSGVTSIGERAFIFYSNLTSVILPDSLTKIGDHAFRGCIELESITIPERVQTIGGSAFQDCTGLSEITFAEGSALRELGAMAFYSCESLTSITIPASVERIGNAAFMNCTSLTEITIPASVQTIGDAAFYGCGLTTITFAGATPPTTIGNYAFSGCNISTVNVPAGAEANYASILTLTGLTNAQIAASGSGTPGSPSSGTAHDGVGSFGADACYYDADTDSMDDGVKQITYGDAAYYPLFINGGSTPVTDRRMVEGLKIKAKYTEGEDLIEGEPQLVKVCVDGEYRYFIKFNVKQTLDAQLRDVCGTLTLNKSKRDKKDSGDFRVKDLTVDFDFEVGAKYNYADDTRLVIDNDPEIPLWPNEFFILKYDCGEEVEFEFGSDSNEGTFTVDVSGQGKNLITFNTEIEENVAAANPDAKMIAISFNNVRFNRTGVFNYEADDMNYAYKIKNGALVKIAEFANGEVEFNTNTLGRYIFSDVELVSPETINDAVFVRLT